jgi:hypothetical protein
VFAKFSEMIGYPKHDNRKSYEGSTKLGRPHGFGKMIYKDGSWYEGQWESGQRQGSGVFQFPASNDTYKSYQGDWKQDKMHGSGTLYWKEQQVGNFLRRLYTSL